MDQNRVHRHTGTFTQFMTKKAPQFSGERAVFSIIGARSIGYPYGGGERGMNLDPYLRPYTKIKSRWIADPNVIIKTKLVEENIGEDLCDLRVGRFLKHKATNIMKKIDNLY